MTTETADASPPSPVTRLLAATRDADWRREDGRLTLASDARVAFHSTEGYWRRGPRGEPAPVSAQVLLRALYQRLLAAEQRAEDAALEDAVLRYEYRAAGPRSSDPSEAAPGPRDADHSPSLPGDRVGALD